jgi:hypothetical protein
MEAAAGVLLADTDRQERESETRAAYLFIDRLRDGNPLTCCDP